LQNLRGAEKKVDADIPETLFNKKVISKKKSLIN